MAAGRIAPAAPARTPALPAFLPARDGAPASAGVPVHLQTAFIPAALGAACALLFWSCWRYPQRRAGLPPHPSAAPGPHRP